MTKNEFSEALDLARLVAEKTSCGLERALDALASLSASETQPTKKDPPLPRKRRALPSKVLNFIATCPAGTKVTGRQVFEACGLQFSPQDKRLTYLLQSKPGWTRVGKKGGMTLFRKEAGA